MYNSKCRHEHTHAEYVHIGTHKIVAATGKHAVQLDIHMCPNWELLSISSCQQDVNQHPSFSLQYKQTCKWEPFFLACSAKAIIFFFLD